VHLGNGGGLLIAHGDKFSKIPERCEEWLGPGPA
jgi:hypothetical protein